MYRAGINLAVTAMCIIIGITGALLVLRVRIFVLDMIELIQWQSTIGSFISKLKSCKYPNITAYYDGMLRTLLICHFGISVQHTAVFILYVYVISMLLLCCGDIKMNPGPIPFVICTNC